MKCVSGVDAGTEVAFKTNTQGGRGEIIQLIEAVRIVSVRSTKARSRRSWCSIATPIRTSRRQGWTSRRLPIVALDDVDGPEPAPAPAPEPKPPASSSAAEQPRHRRVAG